MREIWDGLLRLMTEMEHFIAVFAESWWLYPWVFIASLIDGFFPAVPSDAMLVASATAWQQSGNGVFEWANPLLWLILLAAIAGGWCGDQIAYLIGSKVNVRRLRIFRNERGVATLNWTEHALERRGTTFIIAGRFIPWGRIAVNLSAGALGYPHRRFMGVDLIGVTLWATWSVALGTVAGSIFEDNLLLSVAIGVTGGILLGLVVDKILALFGLAPVDLPDLAGDIEKRGDGKA